MEIDCEHTVKTILLSLLINQKEGRTLNDLVDLLKRDDIQIIGGSQAIENKESFIKELEAVFFEYKDLGLIYIRSNNLPVPRYVLSKKGEDFLLDNRPEELFRSPLTGLITKRQNKKA